MHLGSGLASVLFPDWFLEDHRSQLASLAFLSPQRRISLQLFIMLRRLEIWSSLFNGPPFYAVHVSLLHFTIGILLDFGVHLRRVPAVSCYDANSAFSTQVSVVWTLPTQ